MPPWRYLPRDYVVEADRSFGECLAEAIRLYDGVRLELSDWYHGLLGTYLQTAPRTVVLGRLLDDLPARLDFGEIPEAQAGQPVHYQEWQSSRRGRRLSRPKRLANVRFLLTACSAVNEIPQLERRLRKYIIAVTSVEIPGFYWSAREHGFAVKHAPKRRKR